MTLRIATFNAENLTHRFDFSGYRRNLHRDRALRMALVKDRQHFERLEEARAIAQTDDAMQLTALAIADTMADIICLQEVEDMETLNAFEHDYMYKMIGRGYRQKFLIEGNDGRGIDVAVMAQKKTADGKKIVFSDMRSHAGLTYEEAGLHTARLQAMGEESHEKIFRRDCLEIDFQIDGCPLTLFIVHFKSMGPGKNGVDGREYTMPVREAEAKATRQIIERKFNGKTLNKNWLVCGDMNDYRWRIDIRENADGKQKFEWSRMKTSTIDILLEESFSISLMERRDRMNQWTLYHTRGPEERHLCQLDYILASPQIARLNSDAIPRVIRKGQPYRTIFPPGQEVKRYPRTGWDRPKSSDHCPVVIELNTI